jgi:hypothetical protein
MKIKILASASDDLINGYNFYEMQSNGLGSYFKNSLYSDIDSLMVMAGIHQKHFNYYRLLSKHFPFAVYYKINNDIASIYAVLDCRQSPLSIREELTAVKRIK